MELLKKKQVFKRRLYGKTIKIALIILILLLIKPTWGMYKKSRESENNLRRAEQELMVLEERKTELSKNLDTLKTEKGRDAEIREKYGVAKEGETVVVIVEDKKTVQPVEAPKEQGLFVEMWAKISSWFR